jgi:hypothetical protein
MVVDCWGFVVEGVVGVVGVRPGVVVVGAPPADPALLPPDG